MAVKKIESIIERITPERAEALLNSSAENRKLRNDRVASYALMMQTGFWRADSNDAILIDANGKLINGQHRLNAVIKAGIPVEMAVRYNADPESYKVMDQGLARKSVDYFMFNFKYKTEIVGSAQKMTAIKHGSSLTKALHGQMTNSATVPLEWVNAEVMDNYEDYAKYASIADKMKKRTGKGSKITFLVFIMLVRYLDMDILLNNFVDDYAKESSSINNVIKLKSYLIKKSLAGVKFEPKELLALLLYVYERTKEGIDLSKVNPSYATETFNMYETMAHERFAAKRGS